MARFDIQFEKATKRPPYYDSFIVGNVKVPCDFLPYEKPVIFNNINFPDSYMIGYNWNSPDGLNPKTVKLISFTDKFYRKDIGTGIEYPLTRDANYLYNASNGTTPLVYPYTMSINDISKIKEKFVGRNTGAELFCGGDDPQLVRRRILTYTISDENDVEGPVKTATVESFQDIS